MGDKFKMITDFSRAVAGKKGYVQDKIKEHAQEISDLRIDVSSFPEQPLHDTVPSSRALQTRPLATRYRSLHPGR